MSLPARPLRSVRREAALLLLLALIPALATAWLHPRRPEWSWKKPEVTVVDLATVNRWPANVLWVDARSTIAYTTAHVPGAVSLNETEWESLLPKFIAAWRPGLRVIVYCDTQACNSSEEVARRLRRELALDEVFVLKGGWTAWQETHP